MRRIDSSQIRPRSCATCYADAIVAMDLETGALVKTADGATSFRMFEDAGTLAPRGVDGVPMGCQ